MAPHNVNPVTARENMMFETRERAYKSIIRCNVYQVWWRDWETEINVKSTVHVTHRFILSSYVPFMNVRKMK